MQNTALQLETFSAIDALRDAVMALQQAKIETASLDARLLLQHVLGVDSGQWLTGSVTVMDAKQYASYFDLIEKRKKRQPIAQLIGKREFWEWSFIVTPDTLDPRPDSETLIEAVLERVPDMSVPLRVLDLGTGTGCLLLTLLKLYPQATGVGVDTCQAALAVAQANVEALELNQRTSLICSNWDEKVTGAFDIVISNPPYIPTGMIATLAPEVREFEPRRALDGGEDGMECYRAIVPQLEQLLSPEGIAVFEIGMGQEKEIRELAAKNQLSVAVVRPDLAGISRCVVMQKQRS